MGLLGRQFQERFRYKRSLALSPEVFNEVVLSRFLFVTNLKGSFQENLIENKMGRTLGCQYRRGSGTTSPSNKRKRHVGASAQACDCRRALQGCRVTLNLDTCDLTSDIHRVNGELTTAIPCCYCRHNG